MKNKYFLIFTALIVTFQINTLPSLRPTPWITEKAIEFLEQFFRDNPDAKVLEFGSGSSTVWFAQRTRHLVSVEHSSEWYTYIDGILRNREDCFPVTYIQHPMPYYDICNDFADNYFDLILVDGRNRSGCIKNAIPKLRSGGVLMLDNAERSYYQKAIKLMAGWHGVSSTQPKPDACGFTYKGWRTNWYVKP